MQNDYLNKMAQEYKAKKGVPGAKKQAKGGKSKAKQVQQALKRALEISSEGQIAVVAHEGKKYFMIEESKFQEGIQNVQRGIGFQVNPGPELTAFIEGYNKLHQALGSLQYELLGRDQFETDEEYEEHKKIVERNEELFAELDERTFPFAEGFGKNNAYRKKILNEFNEFWEANPILQQIIDSKVCPVAGS